MIAGILHTGFTVSDIERSIDWYTRVLGLELVHRQRGDNAYTRTLVGIDDAVIEVAQFAMPSLTTGPSTHMLELIEYVQASEAESNSLNVSAVGTAHLAFIVTDIHERYERMAREGTEFANPPVAITEGANAGGFACYLRDPDGITLELLQFSPERQERLGFAGGPARGQKVALHSVLPEGNVDGYRTDHLRVPEGLLESFKRVGIRDWEIWRSGQHLLHLVTCDDFDAAMTSLEHDPANMEWQDTIGVHQARFEGPDGEPDLRPCELIWTMHDQLDQSEPTDPSRV